MAKKKGNTAKSSAPLKPEQHIRTRMRTLPIARCLINKGWMKNGMAMIIVVRQHKQGNQSAAFYLVDTFCLGVKKSFYHFNETPESIQESIDLYTSGIEMVEIEYEKVHNIIYGAVEFAEEGGIEPCEDFKLTEYFLSDDSDEIPLISYNYGENGKHSLYVATAKELNTYLPILRAHLPEEKIAYQVECFNEDSTHYDNDYAESEYTYKHPNYHTELKLKTKWLFDILNNPDNRFPDRGLLERIMEIPKRDLRTDLENILNYALAVTADDVDNETINYFLVGNSVALLGWVGTKTSLRMIFECLSQDAYWSDYFISEADEFTYNQSIYRIGVKNIDEIEQFMRREGINQFNKVYASAAMAMIAVNHPRLRDKVVEAYRRIINEITKDIVGQPKMCDGLFAAFVASDAAKFSATELLPELKALYDTDCVEMDCNGDFEELKEEVEAETKAEKTQIIFADVYEQFEYLKKEYDY
jgi:hypothetical protein